MITDLPYGVAILFLVTFILTIGFFYHFNRHSNLMIGLILLWSFVQSVLAYKGFYLSIHSTPPRFGLVIIPPILLIGYAILFHHGKLDRNTTTSTFLHTIRLPLEIVIYGLHKHEMIPQLMTFEGRNFDIVIGITAIIIGYMEVKEKVRPQFLLAWNIIGLVSVLWILINGVLSAELPFQQFAFEQPNRAVTYFPFLLLPATIVPIVIWTHLRDIKILCQQTSTPA